VFFCFLTNVYLHAQFDIFLSSYITAQSLRKDTQRLSSECNTLRVERAAAEARAMAEASRGRRGEVRAALAEGRAEGKVMMGRARRRVTAVDPRALATPECQVS
jgi:hypothetical protein